MLTSRWASVGAASGRARPGAEAPGRPGARRAARLAAGAAIVAWVVGPTAARSDTDFGTLGLDRLGYGSRVSIDAPSSRLHQESDEFVVHRDVVQSRNNDPGLIQAGIYRSGSGIALDNCGAHAGYILFTEVKPVNSMAYRCQLYSGISPGSTATFDIFRYSAAATWGIRINGVTVGAPFRLGFSKGDAAIGTEIQDLDTNHGTQTATRFAPAGHARWSFYTTTGRSRPHAVTGGDPVVPYPTDDPFWRLPRPPARLTIRHRT
jgi:hypothetical protein